MVSKTTICSSAKLWALIQPGIKGRHRGKIHGRVPYPLERGIYDSHVHLDITEDEWQVFLGDLQASLDKFAVPQAEQGEIFAIVESTKSDIVLPASPPAHP